MVAKTCRCCCVKKTKSVHVVSNLLEIAILWVKSESFFHQHSNKGTHCEIIIGAIDLTMVVEIGSHGAVWLPLVFLATTKVSHLAFEFFPHIDLFSDFATPRDSDDEVWIKDNTTSGEVSFFEDTDHLYLVCVCCDHTRPAFILCHEGASEVAFFDFADQVDCSAMHIGL